MWLARVPYSPGPWKGSKSFRRKKSGKVDWAQKSCTGRRCSLNPWGFSPQGQESPRSGGLSRMALGKASAAGMEDDSWALAAGAAPGGRLTPGEAAAPLRRGPARCFSASTVVSHSGIKLMNVCNKNPMQTTKWNSFQIFLPSRMLKRFLKT